MSEIVSFDGACETFTNRGSHDINNLPIFKYIDLDFPTCSKLLTFSLLQAKLGKPFGGFYFSTRQDARSISRRANQRDDGLHVQVGRRRSRSRETAR